MKQRSAFNFVSPKVKSTRNGEVTAFGFPTIHAQDEEAMHKMQKKAGVPGSKAKTSTGSPLVHTRYVENELLVSKNNPIQNSIKQYTFEMKKTTKKGGNQDNDVCDKHKGAVK